MYGNAFKINDDDNIIPYDDDDADKPVTIQAAQRQINAILAGRTTTGSINDFTSQAKREYDEFFSPNKTANRTVPPSSAPTMYAKNNDHDAFLYNRWNKNTTTISPSTTKPTPTAAAATTGKTTAYAPIEIPVKDDPSVTPTLETLCTLDTCSSDPTYNDTDAILNITIWNQPIVQYRMPIRPFVSPRNRYQLHLSTAVQYALIGVHDKLLNPSKLPRLLSFFTSIITAALSCFNFLAASFAMVKIDDRFPDEWND